MTIYDIFFFVFSLIYLPYLAIKGKAHKDFMQRFGRLPAHFREIGKSQPIWLHAVSVGEVFAVKNFVKDLKGIFPEKRIILSTTTRTGNTIARKILTEDVLKFYFPLDFSFVVRRVANLINPSLFVITETEIWPNLILELSKRNIPIILINGRISDRSFGGYKKIRFLFTRILKRINLFLMQTEKDAERIKALGAREENVKVTGNMKFDIETAINPRRCKLATPGVARGGELLIAGSTHTGEEEIILDVYVNLLRKFPNIKLLIAPRHIDRAEAIKRLAEQKGFEGILLSRSAQKDVSEKSILILDTLGELAGLYSLATIVFMGGSLIKRGGHNLVEPAIFGKPIIFGHYMSNFRDMARLFLEYGAAIEVKDRKGLSEVLESLLENKDKRDRLGRSAKELVDKSKGATERNMRELKNLFKNRKI